MTLLALAATVCFICFALGFIASCITFAVLAHRQALNLRTHTWRAPR